VSALSPPRTTSANSASVRALTPAFGAYAAQSAQYAGDVRHAHARLAASAEEVAFLQGEEAEKLAVERVHAVAVLHEQHVLGKRWWHACAEEGIVKWLWGSFGVSRLGCDVSSSH
jgi:ATP-binding cassette subfamily D (ALD) long-chain fatty acid import protein